MSETRYVLGTSDHELARLRLQQATWQAETEAWVDRLGLTEGATVIDAGCGPGLVVPVLRERVGETGRVIGVDAEARYLGVLEDTARTSGWSNVETRHGRIEDVELEARADGVFARWMLSFPRDPQAIVTRLASWLAPGGRLVLVDYNHHGVSLYPRSEGFEAVIRATRAWYASGGGDAFVAGRIPELVERAGLELGSLDPIVRCGAPGSPVWRWAEEFFLHHSATMQDLGLLEPTEREDFVEQWHARRKNRNARFYTPIVVSALAIKPA